MLSSHEHVALPVAHKRQCGAAKKQVSASSKKDESVVGEGPFQLVALVGKEKGRWHSELTSFSETLEESVRHHRPLAMLDIVPSGLVLFGFASLQSWRCGLEPRDKLSTLMETELRKSFHRCVNTMFFEHPVSAAISLDTPLPFAQGSSGSSLWTHCHSCPLRLFSFADHSVSFLSGTRDLQNLKQRFGDVHVQMCCKLVAFGMSCGALSSDFSAVPVRVKKKHRCDALPGLPSKHQIKQMRADQLKERLRSVPTPALRCWWIAAGPFFKKCPN